MMLIPLLAAALTFAPLAVAVSASAPSLTAPSASAAAFAPSASSASSPDDDDDRGRRLRASGAVPRRWLDKALERSPTVQRLVARIERSDVIVYLDVQLNLPPRLAAMLTFMAATPTRRIVRATLRRDLPETEAIAMIAHELQHVVEVIDHPEVRSKETLLALYERIGHPTADHGRHWDTTDAVTQGTLARVEARLGVRGSGNAESRKGTSRS